VTHDGRGQALAEFLIWIQDDDRCNNIEILGGTWCASSNISSLISNDFICVVRGRRVPAHFDTKTIKDWSGAHSERRLSRETVVSCAFNSSEFSLDDRIVHVDLVDMFTNFKVHIPFCSLRRDRKVQRIVACSQPIYNAGVLEARWPGLMRYWVLYYASHPQSFSFSLPYFTFHILETGQVLGV
jgi:hypothetical protein